MPGVLMNVIVVLRRDVTAHHFLPQPHRELLHDIASTDWVPQRIRCNANHCVMCFQSQPDNLSLHSLPMLTLLLCPGRHHHWMLVSQQDLAQLVTQSFVCTCRAVKPKMSSRCWTFRGWEPTGAAGMHALCMCCIAVKSPSALLDAQNTCNLCALIMYLSRRSTCSQQPRQS